MAYLDQLLQKAKDSPYPSAQTANGPGEKVLIDSYDDVKIYRDSHEAVPLYEIESPHFRGEEKNLIEALMEIALNVITVEAGALTAEEKRQKYFQRILEIIEQTPELKVPVNAKEFYAKAVVREMVGYGLIDSLTTDDQLEEIMIIGPDKPVYVYHRKHDMVKTNIVFYADSDIRNLADRIARSVNRRIDLQTPLLDARLPDGTRVNATIPPISLDGTTITLRKFKKDPLSVVDLAQYGTLNYEVAGFLWMASDGIGAFPANVLVAGGTASGKCVTGDTLVTMADGTLKPIRDIVESRISSGVTDGDGWQQADGDGTQILSFEPTTMKIKPAPIEKFWKHDAPEKLIKIRTRTGKEITSTPEHPFFVLENGSLRQKRADELSAKHRIATPRRIPHPSSDAFFVSMLEKISDLFVSDQTAFVKTLFQHLKKIYGVQSIDQVAEKLGVNSETASSWTYANAIPLKTFIQMCKQTGVQLPEGMRVKSKTSPKTIRIPNRFSPALARLLGLVLADGHLDHLYVEFNNTDEDLLQEFIQICEVEFGIKGKIEKKYGRARVHSTALVGFFSKIFEVPVGVKSGSIRIPDFIMQSSNEHVSELLGGLFDCDGYVCNRDVIKLGKNYLEYSTKSRPLAQQLATLLLRFGIVSHTEKGQYNSVFIYGKDNCTAFAQSVSLHLTKKRERLQHIVSMDQKPFSQIELYSGLAQGLKEARKERNLTTTALAKEAGLSPRLIRFYESGERLPTRYGLQHLLAPLSGTIQAPLLTKLIKGDVFFDELTEVTVLENHGEKFVYDLTVAENHTFIAGDAGGVVAHNTTALNMLTGFVPNNERVITIEDTAELNLPLQHWIRMEVRPRSIEGTGEVSMDDLVKNSLRMRPDRIIVGEVRGAEGHTMFAAMNTGHRGVMGTVHANSARETLVRLTSPPIDVPLSMISSLNLIVMINRIHDRRKGAIRRITEIAEVVPSDELKMPTLQVLYQWDPISDTLSSTGIPSFYLQLLSKYTGRTMADLNNEISERARILQTLGQQGKRHINDVCTVTQNYLASRRLKV